MSKKEFLFYQDCKYTVWERTEFTINAETEEEAKEIALKMQLLQPLDISDSSENIDVGGGELLYDTVEFLTPKYNQMNPTIEVYYGDHRYSKPDDNPILTNCVEN